MTPETKGQRPRFRGGPHDGELLEEKFPEDHPLHGALPNGVRFPHNPPGEGPRLPLHEYVFEAGDYQYTGEVWND